MSIKSIVVAAVIAFTSLAANASPAKELCDTVLVQLIKERKIDKGTVVDWAVESRFVKNTIECMGVSYRGKVEFSKTLVEINYATNRFTHRQVLSATPAEIADKKKVEAAQQVVTVKANKEKDCADSYKQMTRYYNWNHNNFYLVSVKDQPSGDYTCNYTATGADNVDYTVDLTYIKATKKVRVAKNPV